jgi:excisionase family DNA binding protein
MPELEGYVTVAEAAEKSGYSVRHLQNLLKQGVIPGLKPARDWLVKLEDVLEYKKHAPKPGPKPRTSRKQ